MKLRLLFFITVSQYFFVCIIHAQNIGAPIEEPEAIENAPVISLDGKSLIYVSNLDGFWKLYESQLNDSGQWEMPVSIESINQFVQKKDVIRGPFLSYDGNTMYFSANYEGGLGSMDIYFSRRVFDQWTQPENIGSPINSEQYEGSPSISTDDRSLYFVRDEAGSSTSDSDCKTIYVSHKDLQGNWSEPYELPPPINLSCEKSPRICCDNKTLMFCSYREGSEGYYDIYMSKKIDDYLWSEPKHLDFASTIHRDQFPSVSASSDILYFNICQVLDDRTSWCGIYKVNLPAAYQIDNNITYKGFITDEKNNPLKAEIIVYDDNTSALVSHLSSYDDGKYAMVLTKGMKYKIEVFKKNYSKHIFYVDALHIDKNQIIDSDIVLYQFVNLKLHVFDKELFTPIDAEVNIMNKSSGARSDAQIEKLQQGIKNLQLKIGQEYSITVSKDFYSDYNFTFYPEVIYYSTFERDIDLQPTKKTVDITVFDEETDELIEEFEIEIVNLVTNERMVKRVKKEGDGTFSFDIREGDDYEINISGPKGYSFYNSKMDFSKKESTKLDARLKPLKAKTKIVLNNITFETNSADLNLSSFEELDRVVRLLSDNPEIKIEISAHTDDVGSERYNFILSEKRARSVVNYLVQNNISVDQLIYKGYGELKPLVANNSEENRAMNRRVELKIVDAHAE